jgi:hypothetical protein
LIWGAWHWSPARYEVPQETGRIEHATARAKSRNCIPFTRHIRLLRISHSIRIRFDVQKGPRRPIGSMKRIRSVTKSSHGAETTLGAFFMKSSVRQMSTMNSKKLLNHDYDLHMNAWSICSKWNQFKIFK